MTLALTAALIIVRACEKTNRYADSRSGTERTLVTSPQIGARWAFRSLEARSDAEKAVKASIATSLSISLQAFCPLMRIFAVAYCTLKLRSHTVSNARPCAMLARRATVQGVLASKSLSKLSISPGLRYPARTYGNAVPASVARERRRKV